MYIDNILVEFVKYLHKEESIQGTLDEDALMLELAREYLAILREKDRIIIEIKHV